jgi:hypothetical protein
MEEAEALDVGSIRHQHVEQQSGGGAGVAVAFQLLQEFAELTDLEHPRGDYLGARESEFLTVDDRSGFITDFLARGKHRKVFLPFIQLRVGNLLVALGKDNPDMVIIMLHEEAVDLLADILRELHEGERN